MAGISKLTPEQRKINRKAAVDGWRARNSEYDKQYYMLNVDKHKKNGSDNYRRVKDAAPWVLLYRSAKARATVKGWVFNITIDYLAHIWPTHCPILGILLMCNRGGKPHDGSPSIDRTDSSKGYVVGNIAIISYKANVIKNSGTADEHRMIANYIDMLSNQSISSEGAPIIVATAANLNGVD